MTYVAFEKYQCKQMLKAIEAGDMNKLKKAVRLGNPDSVLGIQRLDHLAEYFNKRRTPLQLACEKGDLEMVRFLVENGANVDYIPMNTCLIPLEFAAKNENANNLEIVRYLLEKGADVDNEENPGDTLIEAVFFDLSPSHPNHMDIVRELMKATKDPTNKWYLQKACYRKHEEAIRFLVEEYGFDASDPFYLRAYCWGYTECSRETFKYFLERGADPYAKDEYGKCAIDYLKENPVHEKDETLAELAKEYGFEKLSQ